MTNERWQLAYTIYEAAAGLAEANSRQYVESTAPDDEIAEKVLAMLAETETMTDSEVVPGSPYSTGTNARAASRFNRLPKGAALGRFLVNGFVGQGGMGTVYSPHDPDLNREVALKVIVRKADASASERFIREAQAASALNHANIVTVHEVIRSGPHGGDCHGISEWKVAAVLLRNIAARCEGGSLGTADRRRSGCSAQPWYRPPGISNRRT